MTTRIFAATVIRSCSRMIFETAAAISGVRPGASAVKTLRRRLLAQQPVTELADRQVRHRCECSRVMPVNDQPRDLVRFIGDNMFSEKGFEREIAQGHLGRYPLLGATGRNPRQIVPGARGRRLGQDGF